MSGQIILKNQHGQFCQNVFQMHEACFNHQGADWEELWSVMSGMSAAAMMEQTLKCVMIRAAFVHPIN